MNDKYANMTFTFDLTVYQQPFNVSIHFHVGLF